MSKAVSYEWAVGVRNALANDMKHPPDVTRYTIRIGVRLNEKYMGDYCVICHLEEIDEWQVITYEPDEDEE